MPAPADILALYEQQRLPLYRFAYRMTGGARQQAEDLVHDCFVELLRGKVPAGDADRRVYLFGVLRNLYRRRYVPHQDEVEAEALPAAPDQDPFQERALAERGEAVLRAIAALPPLQREALVLFEFEELSLEEIARVAESGTGTIKARLHRARENLRKQLAPLLAPTAPERNR